MKGALQLHVEIVVQYFIAVSKSAGVCVFFPLCVLLFVHCDQMPCDGAANVSNTMSTVTCKVTITADKFG